MLNSKELATVLAALRYWQNDLDLFDGTGPHFADHAPLTSEEIDALCEQLNAPPVPPRRLRIAIVIDGGSVSCALTDEVMDLMVVDYDTDGFPEDDPRLFDLPQLSRGPGCTAPAFISLSTTDVGEPMLDVIDTAAHLKGN